MGRVCRGRKRRQVPGRRPDHTTCCMEENVSKKPSLVVLILILGLVLAACGATQESQPSAEAPAVPTAAPSEPSGQKIESAASTESGGQRIESAASPGGQAPTESPVEPVPTEGSEVVLGEGLSFIFIQHALCSWDSFWCSVEEGIREAADDMGVNVQVWGPEEFDLEEVGMLIDRAVAAGPDGIALTIADLEQLRAPIQRAIDAGIPVVAYNVGAGPEEDQLDYLTYLGSDESQGGYLSALRLAAVGGTRGVCINHQPGNTALDARCEGFVGAMEISDLSAAVLETTSDPVQSQAIIADYYASNPDVDIFLTLGPTGATPFYAFLDGAGLQPGAVNHGTFDLDDQIAARIEDGTTLFAVEQQPFLQGYGAVSILMLKVRYGIDPVLPVTPTGPSFVEAQNLGFQVDRERPVNLVFVQKALCTWDPFWCTVEDGINQAAADMRVNVDLQGVAAGQDEQMVTLVDEAVGRRPDGLALTIADPEQLRAPIQRALDSGIEVVAYNAGAGPLVDNVEYLTYLGMDQFGQYQGGYQAGLGLAEAGATRGVCLNHGVGQADLDARCEGFLAAMTERGLPADVLPISTDPAAAQATIAPFSTDNPGVDTFLTLGPIGASAFYAYIDAQGLGPGDVRHAAFDVNQDVLDRIRNGTTLFAIGQQPFLQGYGTVQTLMLKIRYGINPVLPVTPTGPSIVNQDNVDLVDELFD